MGKTQAAKKNNGLHKCLSPECIEVGKKYTFSFNPIDQPERLNYKTKLGVLTEFGNKLSSLLGGLRYADVDIQLEISSSGRLHFHGYIVITALIDFYFFDIPELQRNGSYEIDYINDTSVWDKYVNKLKSPMAKWCEKNNIVYRINTIVNEKYIPATKIEKIKYDDLFNLFEEEESE